MPSAPEHFGVIAIAGGKTRIRVKIAIASIVGSTLMLVTAAASPASSVRASLKAPDACTLASPSSIGAAFGSLGLHLTGDRNESGTSSACTYTHISILYLEVMPLSQYASVTKVDTQLYRSPTHPAGIGPKGDYFLGDNADVVFVKGPFVVNVIFAINGHSSYSSAGARIVSFARTIYAHFKP